MRELAEREASDAKKRNLDLEEQVRTLTVANETLTLQLNEARNKLDQKMRELDKLKEEQKKKEKAAEDKLNIANCTSF